MVGELVGRRKVVQNEGRRSKHKRNPRRRPPRLLVHVARDRGPSLLRSVPAPPPGCRQESHPRPRRGRGLHSGPGTLGVTKVIQSSSWRQRTGSAAAAQERKPLPPEVPLELVLIFNHPGFQEGVTHLGFQAHLNYPGVYKLLCV